MSTSPAGCAGPIRYHPRLCAAPAWRGTFRADLRMTLLLSLSRLRCALPLAALSLLLAATAAWAAEDPPGSGTFNTPGYTAAPSKSRDKPGEAGAQQADGSGPQLRTPSGATITNPAHRRAGDAQEAQQRRADAAPPKPSEFQKFVEGATGRLLPIFGASFFADAADNFAPVDNVPVSADYTVGPGDEVMVRAWGSIDVDYRTTVDRNGQLNLPKVGSFTVAGVKASELEKQLRAQIARLYTNFNLSVSLGQLRAVKVFVVGPAQRPGVYTLSSQSTLLSAVVAAGGPGPNGSMRKVSLRRDGRVVSELDVYEFLVQGDKSKDVQLSAGDVVVFQPAGARVALNGAIDNAAVYELKGPQEPVRELLRYAGGAPVLANPNRAQLERIDPTQPQSVRFVEEFKLDGNGLQKPLRDGDVLSLLAISPAFANAVTLKGHVAQPLRTPYKPGMRIRDLIPDKDALISPDFYRRKNLLVQMLEPEEDSRDDGPRGGTSQGSPPAAGSGSGSGSGSSSVAGVPAGAGAGAAPPSVAAAPRKSSRNRSDRSDRDDDRLASERPRKSPTTLFDELNWDYAVVERLNEADLTTRVIAFNLGAAVLRGDPLQNIELLPGDVVTVYSQKDIRVPVARQTRLVSLEGEVGAPGVYQVLPGETLRQLIVRAGGFTPQAYIYGLEFTREETRQRQRENLAAAIARLEALTATQAAREAANRRDEASADRSASVSNAATQAQLSRLARLQPNGRIALELDPSAATVDALPDLLLENADRISVPPRPGFVTVAGAVVNSNAFLWKPGRTAGDYLKIAGVDESADPANTFILRADGTVSHATDTRSFFNRGGVESQPMQPGDAVIVPNQLDFETFGRALVRNLKDYSQIFANFGLGVAAINTLKK